MLEIIENYINVRHVIKNFISDTIIDNDVMKKIR